MPRDMMANSHDSHDAKLKEIIQQEGDSIPAFFNAVFGFLSRHCPEKIYNSSQISGEHLINQSFCKWREKYLQDKLQNARQTAQINELEVPPAVAEEVVITDNVNLDSKGASGIQENGSAKDRVLNPNKSGKTGFNAVNGAARDSYAWSQTIDDLEVRIPVPQTVKRGKQVKVQLQASSLDMSIQDANSWRSVVSGKLVHNIKAEESIWSLVPGEHVLINLEKKEERWWDRLLNSEDPIDLKKIDAERDFSTLPQEEQEKIRELVWNKQQQDQGKPTTDRLKMESMLREAWDAEGSPFKGKAYDPSLVNFSTGGHFGT